MSVSDVHERLLNETSSKFDKTEGSWTYDVTKSIAIEIKNQEEKNAVVLDKLDIENLTGDELERWVYQRTGIEKKQATFATTNVILSGSPGAIVNLDDLVAADDIFYEVVEGGTLNNSGTLQVLVKCQQSGPIGNVPAQAINVFPIGLENINTVINLNAVTNGYEAESDSSLRQRYYDKLQRPGKAGNEYHYLEWALAVSGVIKAKVFPLWNGPLTVKVSIVDANESVAPIELINATMNYINSERPFGAIVTVASAVAKVIDVSVDLTLGVGYEIEDVEEIIAQNITAYFKRIAFAIDYVSHAQIGSEILSVTGVVDYTNLTLNGVNGNVQLTSEEVPVLGVISV